MELDLDAMETCCKFLFVGGGANIYNKNQYVLKHLKKRRFLYQAFPVFLPHQKIISSQFHKKLVCCLLCVSPPPCNYFFVLTYETCWL